VEERIRALLLRKVKGGEGNERKKTKRKVRKGICRANAKLLPTRLCYMDNKFSAPVLLLLPLILVFVQPNLLLFYILDTSVIVQKPSQVDKT